MVEEKQHQQLEITILADEPGDLTLKVSLTANEFNDLRASFDVISYLWFIPSEGILPEIYHKKILSFKFPSTGRIVRGIPTGHRELMITEIYDPLTNNDGWVAGVELPKKTTTGE